MSIPRYKLVGQSFEDHEVMFRLYQWRENVYLEETAYSIYHNKDLLASLDSQDAFLIGYVFASEKSYQAFNPIALKPITMIDKSNK